MPILCSGDAKIYSQTWGHLAPMKNTTYKGKIVIARSQFESGTTHLIDFEIPNLESSPWFYEGLTDALYEMTANKKDSKFQKGKCYNADITFRNYKYWITNIKELKT